MVKRIVLLLILPVSFVISLLIYNEMEVYLGKNELLWKHKEREIRSRLLSIPILLYHNIDGKGPFSIDLPVLRQQFQLIRDLGIKVIALSELVGLLEKPETQTERTVVITFDDGYYSMYSKLLPLVKEFGYPVTLFVYSDFIYPNSPVNLNWKLLREMDSSGIDIQCHSISHSDLTVLKGGESGYKKFLYDELYLSKEIIELFTGKETTFFAFPYGRYDLRIIAAAQKAGYKRVFSTDYGSNIITRDNFCLRRQHIKKNYSISYFRSLIE